MLLVLAVLSFMAAVYACGRRNVGGVAAGVIGALLFAALAVIVGARDRYDRDC
jgi:hypothetical protein